MKLEVRNLGYIDNAQIETKDLTIICGKNNSGKTYLSYTIYGLLSYIHQSLDFFQIEESLINDLTQKGSTQIDLKNYLNGKIEILFKKISNSFTERLYRVFGGSEQVFSESFVNLLYDDFKADFSKRIVAEWKITKKSTLSFSKLEGKSLVDISLLNEADTPPPQRLILQNSLNRVLYVLLFRDYFNTPFVISSERSGIQLFNKELDIQRSVVIENLIEKKTKGIDPFDLIDKYISRYPLAIKHNIDYIRDYNNYLKAKSFLLKEECPKLFGDWAKVLGGRLQVTQNELVFVTKGRKTRKKAKIPIYLGSSAAKSLVAFDLYIHHIAQQSDILMIDEPELNLHPDNQISMARIIAQLVNKGIKVFVTTHSDFFVREINNLVLLSNSFSDKEKIMTKYHYKEEEILKPNKLAVYIMDDNKAIPIKVTKDGIEKSIFDITIIEQSNASDEIYYSYKE
jgi:ABC-type cobalamin/Fe3+-siderophores transport system ATPase subunit